MTPGLYRYILVLTKGRDERKETKMKIETRETEPRKVKIWINGYYQGTFPKAIAEIKIRRYNELAKETK